MKAAAPRAPDSDRPAGLNPPPAPSDAARSHEEEELDKALADSFPASDPPSMVAPAPEGSRALVPVEEEGGPLPGAPSEHGPLGEAPTAAVDPEREERIRRRAHELWEGEGRPEHRAEVHWRQAESEEPR